MTPKEKAKELVDSMIVDFSIDGWQSKQCALRAVNEIIKARPLQPMNWDENHEPIPQIDWWKQVKQEIENYEL